MINPSINLLIAEDNPDDATLFRMALKKADVAARLQVVSDGEQTIAYLKGEGTYADRSAHPLPDLLLLDLNMPRQNGFEVLEWIRGDEALKNLIVHVFSASGRGEDVRRVYDFNASSYLIKPSRLSDLVIMIHGLVTYHHFVSLPLLNGAASATKLGH